MAKFLIVDDEPILRVLFRKLLDIRKHEVIGEAWNGVDCLEIYPKLKDTPDFILMDHRMPEKDWLETTKELLELDPKLKIIFISADQSVRDVALKAGAVGFIIKPFGMQTLFDTIDNLL